MVACFPEALCLRILQGEISSFFKKKKKFRQVFTVAPAAIEGSKNKQQFPLIVCSLEDGDGVGRGQK